MAKLNVRKHNRIRLNAEEKYFLNTLFRSSRGYVKIMSTADRDSESAGHQSQAFLRTDCFKEDMVDNAVNLDGFTRQNLYISTSTFKDRRSASLDNILSVNALCVDIDFTGKFEEMEPAEVLSCLYYDMFRSFCDAKYIPFPQYVEFSRHLRFIYLLENPVCLAIKNKRKRQKAITWLKRILKFLVAEINALDPDYNAEIQQLTKFIRCPGSINKRYINPGVAWDSETKAYDKFTCEGVYIRDVHTMRCDCPFDPDPHSAWDIHELSEAVLPELGAWYDPNYKRKKKKKKYRRADVTEMLNNRIALLRRLQKRESCVGKRETMTFLYFQCLLSGGMSFSNAFTKAESFNLDFYEPLKPYEVRSACNKSGKKYFFTERTFLSMLGLSEAPKCRIGRKKADRVRYLKRREAQFERHETKIQKINEKIVEAKRLKMQGLSNVEIGRILGVSECSVRRYLKRDITDEEAELERFKASRINSVPRPRASEKKKSETKDVVEEVAPDPYISEDDMEREEARQNIIRFGAGYIKKWIKEKFGIRRFKYNWNIFSDLKLCYEEIKEKLLTEKLPPYSSNSFAYMYSYRDPAFKNVCYSHF